MLGELCAIRPVIVRSVITLPLTFSSSSDACIQDLSKPVRFCKRKYLLNILASGMSIVSSISSETMTLPLSVFFVGFQPRSIRRSAICLRLAMLKGIYLVLVLSSTLVGSNISCALSSRSRCSSSSTHKKDIALRISKAKPFFSC